MTSARLRAFAAAGALAGLALLADTLPASAQQRLAAVVCVGSELETLATTGPVRRVIRRDAELVYRVGVDPSQEAQVEQGLRSELGGSGEVSCVWSGADQNHLVVVGYQGVARGDLTIDPEDPRYRSLAVGYGTDWEQAEQFATTLNERFATNYDGGGYEVLVREAWGVSGSFAADAGARTGGSGAGAPEPRTVFRDCDACPEMVVVPPGSFMMGSPATEADRDDQEGPRREVTIDYPLAVGVYEVTFAEWDACVSAGGCEEYRAEDEGWGRGRRPVVNVSWEDAQAYVAWLSDETGQQYRLLSEAEWEYVARAGTRTARYWGGSRSGQCRYANGFDQDFATTERGRRLTEFFEPAPCSDGYADRTAPVGALQPNRFGLHDVLGNVWEWTEDCWNDGYAGAPTDGRPWTSGDCTRRMLRGGSWLDFPHVLRSANRLRNGAGDRYYLNGFRLARTMN